MNGLLSALNSVEVSDTTFLWLSSIGKILLVVVTLLQVVPIMIWVERRGSALLQNRLGPNRVGPFGLLQSAADAIKLIFKEDRTPGHVFKFWYFLAPALSVIPAWMTFAVIPFASQITLPSGREIVFQISDLNVGMLYILAVASLGVYGIIMGGWASNSKYALLGSLRSSSQMISYEISMGLALVGIFMTYSSVHLGDIVRGQGAVLLQLGGLTLPKWGIFVQPIGFLLFITAAFAESNRLPFDLPEGESEIVAGYHIEYGSMKFALFMMAEYLHMTTASALMATMYFGGWQIWPLQPLLDWIAQAAALEGFAKDIVRVLFELAAFGGKTAFFLWVYVWVRWTLPRFRFDQVMYLGWKVMLPIGLLNIFATGVAIYLGWF